MNSVFKQVSATFYVDLPFYDMNQISKAAQRLIATKVLQYDPNLDGVILSFNHVAALPKDQQKKMCYCYGELPFSHIKMKADFMIFKPYPKCQLPAVVTFVSSSAISLTIFDYFQGYVDLNQHREDWSFRSDKWVRKDNSSQGFGQNDYVVVEVIDASPNSEETYVFNVKIIRKSDIPPVEQIEPDATEHFQDEENAE